MFLITIIFLKLILLLFSEILLMKRFIQIFFFIAPLVSNSLFAQNEQTYDLFLKFSEFFNSGDFINAEESMLSVINNKEPLPDVYIIAANNNLGVINNRFGRYKAALEFFNIAEAHISNNVKDARLLADIYNNKARIYTYQKSYNTALEYLDQSIRIYLNVTSPERDIFQRLSTVYLNKGIIHFEIKDYNTAIDLFNKSSELKTKMNLSEKGLPYLNLAKTYSSIKDPFKAKEYYLKSILEFKNEFGDGYYRLADVYFDYGLFLRSAGKIKECLEIHKKALSICIKNFGEKHTFVSLAYKHLGDHYLNQHNYDSAIYYYQESLIAVVKDFNDPDIYTNPSIDSAIFDIRLLDNLKSKARALDLLAGQQNEPQAKLRTSRKSLETIELAMQLIDRIRNNYLSEESRIYLAENEKETYVFAAQLAYSLVTITNKDSAAMRMYGIAQKAKAAVLRNEITGNELFLTAGIPDSLREKQNTLSANISAYNNLVLEELRKRDPDNKKISLWKDALFEMNRDKEKIADRINKDYPQYRDLLQKTLPVTLQEIQKHIGKDETVIDYLLSNQYSEGKRKMYIFLITKNHLDVLKHDLDSLFIINTGIIRRFTEQSQSSDEQRDLYGNFTAALFYMYSNLIRPVEGLLTGKRLIVIPDEEIAWLPFEEFLKSMPSPEQADYEGLHYLIRDYTFSYGYSSSLIFSKVTPTGGGNKVYAFAPGYDDAGKTGNNPEHLQGAGDEINAIFRLYKGKIFSGNLATETSFREAMKNPGIFHLAMHSLSDNSDSRYSYMMFDRDADSITDGKLYNYEISLSRIKSPMVVLSACNSGTGTLYHGEGLMSLARGFILAGASSVIKTSWEVNDEVSAAIISRFYYHLSKGKPKDEAMRLSKLEYLKVSPPVYSNPYYWAAYEVMGDNSPIPVSNIKMVLSVTGLVLILAVTFLVIYSRRRRIFPARPL